MKVLTKQGKSCPYLVKQLPVIYQGWSIFPRNHLIVIILTKITIEIIIIIIMIIIITIIIIDIWYSVPSTVYVQKRFTKSQWTDVYDPYSQINSF